ncbi:MAG: flotillin-like protein FloA [Pirellulales bacterium]
MMHPLAEQEGYTRLTSRVRSHTLRETLFPLKTCSLKGTRLDYSLLAQADWRQIATIIVILVVLVIGLILLAVFARYFRLWIQSVTTGAGIGIFDLLGMSFRKVNATIIVRSKIMAVQAGLGEETGITSKALEAHYLAGGRVPLVIQAMIAAKKAKTINLDYRLATAIDLAGRDCLEAVRTSVYPKVIDCPPRGSSKESLDAVAKNGIQLKVKARVTVRANLNQLIGGAMEETIIARVGEGIVSAIGSADRHTDVLESPDRISKAVLARRLDSQTAFEIVSIDIADIDVGDNIGARLQADQAEADMRVARANAESRRAMAVAQEQEKIAEIEESRSKVVEAEAEVPRAIADAFHAGRLGIIDYYKLRNVQADTEMRRAIAGSGSPGTASAAM